MEGVDDDPTVRSLLARLVGQMAMWDAATHDRPYDFGAERTETLADLRAKLAGSGRRSSSRCTPSSTRAGWTRRSSTPRCDPPEVFTYGGMVSHVLTFAAHRRTLVCGALSMPASATSAPATR